MAKKKDKTADSMVAVEEVLGKTEQFIERNQKILIIIISAIVIIVLGFYGYKKLYIAPLAEEAQSQMFMAERYFGLDSLNRALYGDGNNLGFIDLAEEYGVTKIGNLSKYYAGICFLRMGYFEDAIEYLNDFDKTDQMIAPMAYGATGDAYMELGNKSEAVSYYLKAANDNINDFSTPLFLLKAGWTFELMGEYKKAYDVYEKIELNYQRSNEAREIKKYMARAKAKAKQ